MLLNDRPARWVFRAAALACWALAFTERYSDRGAAWWLLGIAFFVVGDG